MSFQLLSLLCTCLLTYHYAGVYGQVAHLHPHYERSTHQWIRAKLEMDYISALTTASRVLQKRQSLSQHLIREYGQSCNRARNRPELQRGWIKSISKGEGVNLCSSSQGADSQALQQMIQPGILEPSMSVKAND